MIYARYERAKKALLEDQIIEERNYQNYIDHLIETAYFGRHEVWALCTRIEEELPTHNQQSF